MQLLNDRPVQSGKYVLYWMQSSHRVSFNHALVYAIERANALDQPLVTFFGLTGSYPGSNLRHLSFMASGLADVAEGLAGLGIPLVVRPEEPDNGVLSFSKDASLVVVDRGYLKTERRWYERVAARAGCQVVQVESNTVVPVETVSQKEEYSAATIRPKISRLLDRFLKPVAVPVLKRDSLRLSFDSLDLKDSEKLFAGLEIDRTVKPVRAKGGERTAKTCLDEFIDHRLDSYPLDRNDPSRDGTSRLSAYLHFGQISPLEIALRVQNAGGPGTAPFLEELIVRRELAINFVQYNEAYDRLEGLPSWARKTLDHHRSDKRPFTYSPDELEDGRTSFLGTKDPRPPQVGQASFHVFSRRTGAGKDP